jgi:nanoRNase/pAp phosphatase (c-di-AMP/oligoRNAs hydrolase)
MVDLLKIPIHRFKKSDLKNYPHIAVVDTQPGFGNNPFPDNRRATIIIDQHHSAAKQSADLVIINTKLGATCEILARALLLLKKPIPSDLATVLVFGISTDTLNLSRDINRGTLRVYGDLLPYCDSKTLAKIQNPPKSREFFIILEQAVHNATLRGNLITSHLGSISNPVYVALMADLLLSYEGIHWSFCTGRYKGRLFVSLRCADPEATAGKVLRDVFENRHRAGGHGTIAGGNLDIGKEAGESRWKEAEKNLVKKLIKRLRIKIRKKSFPFKNT